MQIDGAIKGDLEIRGVKYYPSTNARMATVAIKTKVDAKQAQELFGASFVQAAFAPIVDDGNGGQAFAYKSMTPDMVCEVHSIELLGMKGRCTPEIGAIKPVKDEQAVIADVVLPLPVAPSMREFYGNLCLAVGNTTTVAMKALQPSLPGTDATTPEVQKVPGPHGAPVPQPV